MLCTTHWVPEQAFFRSLPDTSKKALLQKWLFSSSMCKHFNCSSQTFCLFPIFTLYLQLITRAVFFFFFLLFFKTGSWSLGNFCLRFAPSPKLLVWAFSVFTELTPTDGPTSSWHHLGLWVSNLSARGCFFSQCCLSPSAVQPVLPHASNYEPLSYSVESGSHYNMVQAGFELMILLAPKCWDSRPTPIVLWNVLTFVSVLLCFRIHFPSGWASL